jgi:pyroglutamyl-peptidase
LSLGLSETSDSITLERKAINLKQDVELQNSRNIKGPKLILLGSPISYKSTLPLDRIYRSLKDRNIPVTISDNAGRYVCNYVFYLACHQIKLLENSGKTGFIHVPLMSEQILEPTSDVPGLPLSLMVNDIESCIEIIISIF